jgi:RNA polymerase sigma-B factor
VAPKDAVTADGDEAPAGPSDAPGAGQRSAVNSRAAPPDADELEQQLRLYRETGDTAVRDKVVESQLGLAIRLARRFADRGEALDDLVQAASIGLVKAVQGFDPDLGYGFAAYGSTTIIGELKRHFRDKVWTVRAPRRVQELYLEVGEVVRQLSQELGRSPTIPELCGATGASEEDVLEALDAGYALKASSLDAPGQDGGTVGSRLGGEDAAFDSSELRLALESHLAKLEPRARTIIELRFFADLTQSEIAQRVGLSQMHVSRLIARSLRQLQLSYAEELADGGDVKAGREPRADDETRS